MPYPVHIPRINNNEDSVRVASIAVAPGARVRAGDVLMQVESDKAVLDVEAERDGVVLALRAQDGAMAGVGTVAIWLGDEADEAVPEEEQAGPSRSASGGAPTAKALLLLRRYGIAAEDVPASGPRLTAAEVEAHAAVLGLTPRETPAPVAPSRVAPELPEETERVPLTAIRRGMAMTVAWQRDHAAATYLEVEFDPAPWDDHAAAFGKQHRLMFSPLLSLLAHRVVELARETGGANGSVVEQADGPVELRYSRINLGFTVQAGETLYLAVLRDAGALDAAAFVAKLGDLQRRALAHRLEPAELRGATIGFSSMARWGVSRHVPILAPWTSLMVAHTVAGEGASRRGVLGATYDHRLLSGFDVARFLRALAKPPA